MKWLSDLFLVSCVFLMFGCKKYIKPEYPYENGCERFAGEYIMYDPINEISYVMTCDCIPKNNQVESDSLVFINYANMFDFQQSVGYGSNDPGHFSGVIISPITDFNGYSWSLATGGYSSTEDRLNRLVGDSLYIRFSISNYPYYAEEDTLPIAQSEIRHYGVKVH